jgi:flagellin
MSLRINQNIPAMNAYNNLRTNGDQMSKSLERLSSGFRINRAADDAAGLSVSEGLRAQIGGLQVAVRNAQDGINVVQTAEGGMNEVHSILQRMRDLSVQATNSGSQDQSARTAAQSEVTQLNAELDRIGNTTRFGGQQLLKGTPATVTGAVTGGQVDNSGGTMSFDIGAGSGTFANVVPGQPDVDLSGKTVTLATGIYNSAGEYQNALQSALDATATANNVAAGSIKATVADEGGGVWKVSLGTASLTTVNTFGIAAASTTTGVGGANAVTSTSQANAFTGTFQIGANQGESLGIQFQGISSTILGTGALDLVNNASAAITTIDSAIQTVSDDRASLGAYQNRFEHTINSLNVAVQNLSASESQIRDTDMASEMVKFTRSQILGQAGTAMLAQANQAPQSVLKLLQ